MSQHQAGFAGVPVKRLKQTALTWKGAVHNVRHAILANFDPPSPCHTLSHIPRPPKVRHTSRTTPPPIFSRPSTKTLTKAPCTNSLSIVRGVFVFCLEGFVRSPSLRMHVLQQKVKHHLKFHVSYYIIKEFISVTSHALYPPSVTNCHTFSDPIPLERDVLYGRPQSQG